MTDQSTAWTRGYLLDTPTTRAWDKDRRAEEQAHEERCVFTNFRASDQGRSRILIAQFKRAEDACLGATAPELLQTLQALDAFWSEGGYSPDDVIWTDEMRAIWKRIRAAIAQATGAA